MTTVVSYCSKQNTVPNGTLSVWEGSLGSAYELAEPSGPTQDRFYGSVAGDCHDRERRFKDDSEISKKPQVWKGHEMAGRSVASVRAREAGASSAAKMGGRGCSWGMVRNSAGGSALPRKRPVGNTQPSSSPES